MNEVRNALNATSAEKERHMREKLELNSRIQGLVSDRDSVYTVWMLLQFKETHSIQV